MNTKRIVVDAAEEVMNAYFPVLDHGFVALKDYMGSDQSVEESARVSFAAEARHIHDTRGLIRYLMRHKHTSPFEMVEMRFHIGLPIFVMRQLVRHRTANLNEYSGRYSVMPQLFYTPAREQMALQSTTNKQGRSETILGQEEYDKYLRVLSSLRHEASENYKDLLSEGVAKELARLDLPLSMYTYCYWKIDLRNLFNVISLRSDPHAQWEIQKYSDTLAGIAYRLCPIAFEAFEDYCMGTVTYTRAEQAALVYLSNLSMGTGLQYPTDTTRSRVNGLLDSLGVYFTKGGKESREQTEFWDKLKIAEKREFMLDVSEAKPSSFFEDMVKQHAVEIPK